MKLVQRGNKQLRVDDVRAEELLKAGYVEIDQKTGKPIKAETTEDGADKALKKENAALKKENKELKAQVAELTAQVSDLTARVSAQSAE